MAVKGLASGKEVSGRTRIQLEVARELRDKTKQDQKTANSEPAALREPGRPETSRAAYRPGRRRGQAPAEPPVNSAPPPAPTESTTPTEPEAPTTSAPSPQTRGPRVRIQIEIARDAGLIPATEKNSEPASEKSTTSGTTIQNQLLINGAGFTSGVRSPRTSAELSVSASVSESDPSAFDPSEYQSPSQLLEELAAAQVLNPLKR